MAYGESNGHVTTIDRWRPLQCYFKDSWNRNVFICHMLYIDVTWRNDIPEYLRLWTRISPVCPSVTQTSPQRVDAPYSRRTHSGNGPLTGRGRTRTRASIQSKQTESETVSVVTRQCRQICSGVGTKSTLRGDLKPEGLNRRDFWRGAINPLLTR